MPNTVRRALLVGLNQYPDPRNNLKGCVNDVLLMGKVLMEHMGFNREDVRLLTDKRATTANLRARLDWLVRDAGPGSILYFHYSGHGAQVRDRNGDELDDGLDEILCPYDLDWDHPFTDDELGEVVDRVPDGANLTIVLDCCHSGTGTRVFYKEPVSGREPTPRYLTPPPDIGFRAAAGVALDPARSERTVNMEGLRFGRVRRFGVAVVEQKAVLIAGCRSDQTSADAWIDNDHRGALSYSVYLALRENRFSVSNRELVRQAGDWLEVNRYDQVPQLEGPRQALDWTFLGTSEHRPDVEAPETPPALVATGLPPEVDAETQVVFVHGIGDHTAGYSAGWRRAFNRYLNLDPGNFHEVLWDDVFDERSRSTGGGEDVPDLTAAEKRRLVEARARIRALVEARQEVLGETAAAGVGRDAGDRAVDRGFFTWIANFDEYIGDFMKYLVSERVRAAVDARLTTVLAPLCRSGLPVVLVTHSWGTVVGHHVLTGADLEGRAALHVTLGSPLWMWPVRTLLGFRGDPGACQQWVNVDAEGDLVGGKLAGKYTVTEDYLVPSVGGQPHGSYFHPDNERVQRDIVAAAIRRMDLSFLRD